MAQAVKLKDAYKMMTEVWVDEERRVLGVRFADGVQGEIPLQELKHAEKLDLRRVELPNPYVVFLGVQGEEEPVGIPWDFARFYCDPKYAEKVRQGQGRERRALAQNVKRLRSQRGWTQRELARRSRVSRITISRIENENEPAPRVETLERLAEAFGVSLAELFRDSAE